MRRPADVARLALIGAVLFVFVYPLLRLLALPLAGGQPPIGGWRAVGVSFGLGLATAALAAPLGAVLAGHVATRSGPVARLAALTLWALFLAPSYVMTTGWLLVFARPGLRDSLAGHAFFGPAGLILLYTLKALPFCAFVARATLAGSGAAAAEAAAVLGLSRLRRARIRIGVLAPALASGAAVAVIETMQDFGIPATLGSTSHLPILTYAIYRHLAEIPTDFAGAAVLCWWLILIGGALALAALAAQRRDAALVNGRLRPLPPRPPTRMAAVAMAGLVAVLLLLGVAIPLAALAARALAAAAPLAGLAPVARSLGFGVVAGGLALAVALALLKLRAGPARRSAALLDAVLAANMAVPGLVLGAGYVVAFNSTLLPLYGTTALLVIGYAAGMIPLALRMTETALGDLDRNLGAAARLHGLSRATRAIDIEAALLARPLAYAFVLVCGAVMFELPISELLYPPGATPLGVAIVALDQMGRYADAARLALIGVAAMAGFAALVVGAARVLAAPPRTAAA